MNQSSVEHSLLFSLIEDNEKIVRRLYRLLIGIVFMLLIAHLGFGGYATHALLLRQGGVDSSQVVLYGVFNLSLLVIEIYMCRVGFMLGARAGQLREIRCCLLLSQGDLDLQRLQAATQAFMSIRRSESGLKVLGVEEMAAAMAAAIAGKLPGAKPAEKDGH